MTIPRIRLCTDYQSTKDCFTYFLVHAPKLDPDSVFDSFEEAFADFRLGILDSLKAANVAEDSSRAKSVLMMIDAAYKMFKEDRDPRPACHILQDAEEEFVRLCSRKRQNWDIQTTGET